MSEDIGDIYVDVVADATDLEKNLKRRLERIGDTLGKRLGDQLSEKLQKSLNKSDIDFSVSMDESIDKVASALDRALEEVLDDQRLELSPDMRRSIRSIAEELDESLEDVLEDQKLHVQTVVDDAYLKDMKRDIDRAIGDLSRRIDMDVNSEEVKRKIQDLADEADDLRGKLRDSILSTEDALVIQRRLNAINDEINHTARDRETQITADPFTTWASARLAWLTRTRFVTIVPQLSKLAFAEVVAAFAGLSGARLAGDYIERFYNWVSELDRALPKLTFGILGVTAAIAGLLAGVAGIVGIGNGLISILPALLVVPGLIAGAVMSVVTIAIAMKDVKTELAELGPGFTNLGAIIKKTFWNTARPTIISFVNSIMPQLERSFERLAGGIGRFTASISAAFEREFANGRLEAMFIGLEQVWDILATGADAFARAITNLGLVAAKYMPRLAQWFVDLSIRFDNWLSAVATDGRLDAWIEEAIDNMYALWDVVAATAGIFEGFWKAAETAGSKGLRGFADMLLRWEEAVNGQKWQDTLAALFRGSYEAMSGFGKGLEELGNALYYLREPFEYILGASGQAVGRFIENLAKALQTPKMKEGLVKLVDGLAAALDSLEPAMGPVSDAFATLIGFIGELARVLGPVISKVLEVLAPVLTKILDALEPLLPVLGDALIRVIERLEPHIDTLADAFIELLPGIVDILEKVIEFSPELVILALAFSGIVSIVGKVVFGFGKIFEAIKPFADLFAKGDLTGKVTGLKTVLPKLGGAAGSAGGAFTRIVPVIGGVIAGFVIMYQESEELRTGLDKLFKGIGDFVGGIVTGISNLSTKLSEFFGTMEGSKWMEGAQKALDFIWDMFVLSIGMKSTGDILGGLAGAIGELLSAIGDMAAGDFEGAFEHLQGFYDELLAILVPVDYRTKTQETFTQVKDEIIAFFADPSEWLAEKGTELIEGLTTGIETGFESVTTWFAELPQRIKDLIIEPGLWLSERGGEIITGLRTGLEQSFPVVGEWFGELPGRIIAFFITAITWLIVEGSQVIMGFFNGLKIVWENVTKWFSELPTRIREFFTGSDTLIEDKGRATTGGFNKGAVTGWNAVVAFFQSIPSRVTSFFGNVGGWLESSGSSLIDGFKRGIENSFRRVRNAVADSLADIRALFPFSPAKEGPFSGRGWVAFSGESVGRTFVESTVRALDANSSKITDSMGGISDSFSGFSDTAISAGIDAAEAFANGLYGGKSSVERAAEELTKAASSSAAFKLTTGSFRPTAPMPMSFAAPSATSTSAGRGQQLIALDPNQPVEFVLVDQGGEVITRIRSEIGEALSGVSDVSIRDEFGVGV